MVGLCLEASCAHDDALVCLHVFATNDGAEDLFRGRVLHELAERGFGAVFDNVSMAGYDAVEQLGNMLRAFDFNVFLAGYREFSPMNSSVRTQAIRA